MFLYNLLQSEVPVLLIESVHGMRQLDKHVTDCHVLQLLGPRPNMFKLQTTTSYAKEMFEALIMLCQIFSSGQDNIVAWSHR